MLKTLTVNGVRGITLMEDLDKLNVISGDNGSGKSTIIDSIADLHRGTQTKIKEGQVTLITEDGATMNILDGKMHGKLNIGSDFDMCIPGNFMGGKSIKGLNSTQQEMRETISKLLGIDRDGFFKKHKIDYELTGLYSEMKELEIESDTYTKQLMDKEEELDNLKKVSKPKEVKLTEGNEDTVNGFKSDLKIKEEELKSLDKVTKPKEVKLIESKTTVGNENELDNLKSDLSRSKDKGIELSKKLEDIKYKGEKINQDIEDLKSKDKQKCPTCKQVIDDISDIIEKYKEQKEELISEYKDIKSKLDKARSEYKEIADKINNFDLIETSTTKGNMEEYQEYLARLDKYNKYVDKKELLEGEISDLKDKIKSTKVVTSNRDKYDAYVTKLQDYNNYINNKEYIEKDIKSISENIKKTSTQDIEEKIERYREVENKFITSMEDKLQMTDDIKFIFYKELKSPNAKGDKYKPIFEIEFQGKEYKECSTGEKGIIDIVIARLFIAQHEEIDFILIDNAEISDTNIKTIIKSDLLKDLQVFVTRINNKSLEIKNKL